MIVAEYFFIDSRSNEFNPKDISSAYLSYSENGVISRSAVYPLHSVNTVLLDRLHMFKECLINVGINQSAVCCLLHPQGNKIIVLHILVFLNKSLSNLISQEAREYIDLNIAVV